MIDEKKSIEKSINQAKMFKKSQYQYSTINNLMKKESIKLIFQNTDELNQ